MTDKARYKVEKVTHYEVVDTHEDHERLRVHWNGPDEEFATGLAAEMNENLQAQLDAQERIQQEARDALVLELTENGKGNDA